MRKLTYSILVGVAVLSAILVLAEKIEGVVTLSAAGAVAAGASLLIYVKRNKAKLQKTILREISYGKK